MKSSFVASSALSLVLFLLSFCLVSPALAAAFHPYEEWNRTFGGQYGDGAWCLQETADGGNILVGYSASRAERSDLFLIKTDENGNCTWSRTFGGSGEDAGYFVSETRDRGFIVVGSTDSYSMGDELLWLLKTDRNGSMIWEKTFGGFVSSSGDGGWSVEETDDGGYIVTGYTQSTGKGRKDLWLIKTDGKGNQTWEKTFGGREDDVGMSVIQSQDGGYIVAGRTASFGKGNDDTWLLKTDSNGREIWNVTFGGLKDDAGFQVVQLADGYAIVSRTDSGKKDEKINLIRTNLEGKKIWERSYLGSSAASLQLANDGGFIISGRIDSEKKGRDALIIKTDPKGALKWSIEIGGRSDDIGTFAIEKKDGSYMMAGITSSFGSGREDAWLVRIIAEKPGNELGNELENPAQEKAISPDRTISFLKSLP
jgi:hypothetical protein